MLELKPKLSASDFREKKKNALRSLQVVSACKMKQVSQDALRASKIKNYLRTVIFSNNFFVGLARLNSLETYTPYKVRMKRPRDRHQLEIAAAVER